MAEPLMLLFPRLSGVRITHVLHDGETVTLVPIRRRGSLQILGVIGSLRCRYSAIFTGSSLS